MSGNDFPIRLLTRSRVSILVASAALEALALDPRSLILESAGREARDLEMQRNYTYRERVVERNFDGAGKAKSTETKVYDVVSFYGEPYHRLVEKDGKALAPGAEAAEQRKMDREMEKRSRESDRDRRNRLAKQAKELDEERAFRREVADAFRFTLLPEETVGGVPCHVIWGDPKPGYQPRTRPGRALLKVKGKLWISQADKRWVKMEAETIDTFSLGWFLLRVARGTRVTLESERVGGEVWMPSHVYLRGDARVAALKRFNLELDVRWSQFRKFSTDSRIVTLPAQ